MPSWLVATVAFAPVAGLFTTTVAPGITAPEGSVTRPVIVPRVSCDQTAAAMSSTAANETTRFLIVFQLPVAQASEPASVGANSIGRDQGIRADLFDNS